MRRWRTPLLALLFFATRTMPTHSCVYFYICLLFDFLSLHYLLYVQVTGPCCIVGASEWWAGSTIYEFELLYFTWAAPRRSEFLKWTNDDFLLTTSLPPVPCRHEQCFCLLHCRLHLQHSSRNGVPRPGLLLILPEIAASCDACSPTALLSGRIRVLYFAGTGCFIVAVLVCRAL